MAGPLQGLTVIEMAGIGPCPLAGQLLADLGARVIRIDRKSGDADPTDINQRSKFSVALNLKSPLGVEAALAMMAGADVLIEGFRPGVMERLGLGPDTCHSRNPRLVYGRMTGWGQTGPLAHTAGHDINYIALSGALAAIGGRQGPPVPPLNLLGDYAGGTMFLLLGVLSALFERQRSGLGQVVDAAMVDGVPALMGLIHAFRARDEWSLQRSSNLLDGGAPFYRCYETADGKAIAVGALEPQFFAELIAKAGIAPDDRDQQYDVARWPQRHDAYAALFRTKSREAWMDIFDGSDACVAPVLDFSEVESHPHNRSRNIFSTIGGVMQPMPAPRFDRTPPVAPRPPEAPGTSTDSILIECGFDVETLAAMREAGVIT